MKTTHLFKQHEQMISENRKTIQELQQDTDTKRQELKELNQQYEQYVNDGQDDKADSLFSSIVSTETAIKMNEKKLNTKGPILKKKERDNAINILKQVNKLPELYADEKAVLEEKYETAKRQLMAVKAEITVLNRTYDDDYLQYVNMYEDYDEGQDKSFRREANEKGARWQDFRHVSQAYVINIFELDKTIQEVK